MATKKRMTEEQYKAQYMAEWKETLMTFLGDEPVLLNTILSVKEKQFDLKWYKRQLALRAKYETPEYKAEEKEFLASL